LSALRSSNLHIFIYAMAPYRALGSLLLVATFQLGAHGSPHASAKMKQVDSQSTEVSKDTNKNLLQKSGRQIDLMDSLGAEDAKMFAAIWAKYAHGEFMSQGQLNLVMRDTDHELEDQPGVQNSFNLTEWLSLCEEKGADPSKGLSKRDFLSLYFDGGAHPESSMKNDFMRIFAEGGTPPPPDFEGSLSADDAKMFAAIWAKCSHGDFMSHEQLNSVLRDTDHEIADQLVNDGTSGEWRGAESLFNVSEWISLCLELGANPDKGISRHDFLSLYLNGKAHPESSIKNDFMRIFAEGGTPPPPKDAHKNLQQKSGQHTNLLDSLDADDAKMFAAIWAKYSYGELMSHEQLNSVLRDTDHELADQVVNDGEIDEWRGGGALLDDAEWVSLCEEMGADPRKGISRGGFLSLYFNGKAHPESSIKSDFMRIFAEGGTPPPPKDAHKNLLKQSGQQMDSLNAEDAKMFAAIWATYAHGEFMSHDGLNSIMRATDHELGDQLFNDTEWLSLCEEKGADPSKGLSKRDFLSLYFDGGAHPESSIKSDFMRIFAEGGTPAPPKDTRKNLLQKSGQQMDLVKSQSPQDVLGQPVEQVLLV
jgi:hypothetical protein